MTSNFSWVWYVGSKWPVKSDGVTLCCRVNGGRPHLVLPQLPGHVLLGPLQSILQVSGSGFGFFHRQFSTLLRFSQLVLQVGALREEWSERESCTAQKEPCRLVRFTCAFTASISFCRRLIRRPTSATSALAMRSSSPNCLACTDIWSNWRQRKAHHYSHTMESSF